MIMKVNIAGRPYNKQSNINPDIKLNTFSTKEYDEKDDIMSKKTKYLYDELTPSSSPSTSEVYSSYEAEESNDLKCEERIVLQEATSNVVCSEYLGDISDEENSERSPNTKLYQRYKKSKLVHRNVTTSYLYRKRHAGLCSSSDEGDSISTDNNNSKFKKIHKRLKRRNKSRPSFPSDTNSTSKQMKENGDKPAENINSPEEVIGTSITETNQEPSQPFVHKSVLSRNYQRTSLDENIEPISTDSYMSQQQKDFHETADRGDGLELRRLLQKTGSTVNINLIDTEGQTALHKSIMNGNFELVKILVNFGANTRLANRDGWTALHMAAHAGHANILVYLFSNLR